MRLPTPLHVDDAEVLDELVAWYADVRNRQAGLHLFVERMLMIWLAEATGQSRTAIVQRLTLEIENLLPPD